MPVELVDECAAVVVGGGPAGAAAALELAEAGEDVLIVEQSAFPREKACGDGLTHAAVSYLEEIGLEPLVEGAQRIEDCRFVLGHGKEMRGWYHPPAKLPHSRFMRTLPRRTMDAAVLDAAIERGARLLEARVDEPLVEDGKVVGLRLVGSPGSADGGVVSARRVIAADGATSRIRRCLGADVAAHGTRLYALRRYFTTEVALDPVFDVYVPLVYEGGLLAGYGWVFPVAENRANVGVALYEPSPGRERTRIRELLAAFVGDLEERSGERFGALTDASKPVGAPIATRFSAERCEVDGVLFAGEAARFADPLTAEGISFALRSGQRAGAAAAASLCTGGTTNLGRELGTSSPRVGQNLSLLVRLAEQAGGGLTLSDPVHQPLLLELRRLVGDAPIEPDLAETPAGRLLAGSPDGLAALSRIQASVLSALRTELPFGLEVLNRELHAGIGPIGAVTAVLAARACGGDSGERVEALAEAVELLVLAGRSQLWISADSGTDLARLNNGLSSLLCEHATVKAQAAAARAGIGIAAATFELSEAAAWDAENTFAGDISLDGLLGAYERRASTLALACGGAAEIAGAGAETVGALERFGRGIGVASRIAEESRALMRGDERTRRSPAEDLRQGRYPLAVVEALEFDPSLRGRLGEPLGAAGASELLAAVRAAGGVDGASARCRERAAAAITPLRAIPAVASKHLEPVAALAVRRLEH
jgi:geranylgeranyl reductase family protein